MFFLVGRVIGEPEAVGRIELYACESSIPREVIESTYMIVIGCNSFLSNVVHKVPEDRISEQCVGLVVQTLNKGQGKVATGTSVTHGQESKRDQPIWDISLECAKCSNSTGIS
jgi:hypothetical protein